MALAVGVPCVSCAAVLGRVCIGSGEGAASSEPRGSGLIIGFWGSSTTSFPLPSSISNEEIASFFSHGQTTSPMSEDSDNPSKYSEKLSIGPSCRCC